MLLLMLGVEGEGTGEPEHTPKMTLLMAGCYLLALAVGFSHGG